MSKTRPLEGFAKKSEIMSFTKAAVLQVVWVERDQSGSRDIKYMRKFIAIIQVRDDYGFGLGVRSEAVKFNSTLSM